jgi:hypothetical protein
MGAELIRWKPSWWPFVVVVILLVLIFAVWNFSKQSINRRFFNFLIAPIVFCSAVFSFLLFIEKNWLYHITVVLAALLLFLFLDQILNYFYFAVRYQPYTLENFSGYLNILSVFAWSSSLLGCYMFLRFSLIVILVVYAGLIFIITKQFFWINKIAWAKYALFCAVISLVMAEMFFALNFFPVSFYVNAFALTIIFYVMVGLSRQFLLENLNRKSIISHLAIASLVLVVVFASAQWF